MDFFSQGITHPGVIHEKSVGCDGRVALPGPRIPMTGEALDAGTNETQFLGKLQGHRRRLLQPLLQVVRVIGPNIFPFAFVALFCYPTGFLRPALGGDEDEGACRARLLAGVLCSLSIFFVGLGGRFLVAADLPPGCANRYPSIPLFAVEDAIPTWRIGGVARGKGELAGRFRVEAEPPDQTRQIVLCFLCMDIRQVDDVRGGYSHVTCLHSRPGSTGSRRVAVTRPRGTCAVEIRVPFLGLMRERLVSDRTGKR